MKELFQVAGRTISPNNKVAVYCGWYCRDVWQRKVEMAKVARNAPELGALDQSASPVAMTSAPRFCLSRAMVNLMQLQAGRLRRIYPPIAQSKWPPDNPGMSHMNTVSTRNIL